MPQIFVKRTCPFSMKVILFLAEAGLSNHPEFEILLNTEKNCQDLKAKTGEDPTFPMMIAEPEAKPMKESDDIIAVLARKYKKDLSAFPALDFYKSGIFPSYLKMVQHIGHPKVDELLADTA